MMPELGRGKGVRFQKYKRVSGHENDVARGWRNIEGLDRKRLFSQPVQGFSVSGEPVDLPIKDEADR